MTNNLEEIVQLVMRAYDDVHGEEYDITPIFELELRKNLMQRFCNTEVNKHTYTYTTNPGSLTGTWSSGTVTSTNKELLNG